MGQLYIYIRRPQEAAKAATTTNDGTKYKSGGIYMLIAGCWWSYFRRSKSRGFVRSSVKPLIMYKDGLSVEPARRLPLSNPI